MITDFHAYERDLCRSGLLPLLRARGMDLTGKDALDVGCGYGGVLAGLAEAFPLRSARGVDLDEEMVASGQALCSGRVSLETRDFFDMRDEAFDFILLRDVLEHMPDAERALAKAASLLRPGGRIFASFAPFYSPFGGHQHNGSGFCSGVPWLQALPESWFRSLVRLKGNAYKTSRGLESDLDSVLRTRLTVARFRRMIPLSNLRVTYFSGYLTRPDFRLKFGLPPIRFPGIPWLEELACTGVEALLAPAGDG